MMSFDRKGERTIMVKTPKAELILSIANLRKGMGSWRKVWGKNFGNSEYYDIYEVRDRGSGPTDEWWDTTMDRLSVWIALRGPKPPNTKAEIRKRGKRRLEQIKKEYAKLAKKWDGDPSIVNCEWKDVETLFRLASQIKKTKSPVFASKMCHFLFPKLFIVMDNWATGVSDYKSYWCGMKDAWSRFNEKSKAKRLLMKAIAIGSAMRRHPLYPLETKIMELSRIGYKVRSDERA
jgi:hypothetical protein